MLICTVAFRQPFVMSWCANHKPYTLFVCLFFIVVFSSFCPTIYGHEMVKAGLILGLFGGSQRHADPQVHMYISISYYAHPH